MGVNLFLTKFPVVPITLIRTSKSGSKYLVFQKKIPTHKSYLYFLYWDNKMTNLIMCFVFYFHELQKKIVTITVYIITCNFC